MSAECSFTATWCNLLGNFDPEGLASARPGSSLGNGNESSRSIADICDAASFAAHKFYGPKGAGFLFLRGGIPIDSIQFGGAHENQRRPGTENVAAIVGMAAARRGSSCAICLTNRRREAKLRDDLWQGIARVFPGAQENAAAAPRLSQYPQRQFSRAHSEMMLIALDLEGICASSGSACMVGSRSHRMFCSRSVSRRNGPARRSAFR